MTDFWEEGLQFECQSSGKCCTSRGSYGYVYLTLEDRQRMAKRLEMTTSQFTRAYCEKDEGLFVLKNQGPDCVFLKDHRCSVYEGRPTQCRTWPWWPELLKNVKRWNKDVAQFCPGVGKGKRHSSRSIRQAMLEQARSDKELFEETGEDL